MRGATSKRVHCLGRGGVQDDVSGRAGRAERLKQRERVVIG